MGDRYDYTDLYYKERPDHSEDMFFRKYPPMSLDKRAKIFSPFDALRGFDAAVDIARDTSGYVSQRELDEGEIIVLNKKLNSLFDKYISAKKEYNLICVRVCYFLHVNGSSDLDGSAALLGRYEQIEGSLQVLDRTGKYIVVDGIKIDFDNISGIEAVC